MSNTLISQTALKILTERYLSNGESVDGLFRRVSLGNEDGYRLMSQLKFLPNSPTLFNAGMNNGCTSSACFTFMMQDSMFGPSSIVETRNKAIAVAKAGGGVGYNFSNLRRKNSLISSIHRKACGPVAVLKDYNAVEKLITQGGKRALAQMGVLAVEHDDIEEFINVKNENPKELGSFNISVNWSNQWLHLAFGCMDNIADPRWKSNRPHDLWRMQCESAWRTGCPGMFFPDIINKFNENPHLGLVVTPNPCVTGETPILTRLGEVRIDSVVGKTVDVWNGEEWSEVVPRITGENQQIIRVQFVNDRHLDCTHTHRFYLVNGKAVQAIELNPGDMLEANGLGDPNPRVAFLTQLVEKAEKVYCFKEEKRGRGVFNGILTGQCGEAPNRDNEACSLGSTSIARYVDLKTKRFRHDEFMHDCACAFRYLDHIFDNNIWPHPEITAATQRTRRLGFGIMGWADFLALQGMHYDDPKSREYGEKIWKDVDEVIKRTSVELAREKGAYPGYSIELTKGEFRRNETCSSIAPTGTIAEVADVWGSIEPHLYLDAERTTNEGFKLATGVKGWVQKHLDGFVPKIASEISVRDHILMQAAFQKSTDLAVSKTINMPKSSTVDDVSRAYRLLYESGCKGGTIFRDGCREDQVIRETKKIKTVYDAVPIEPVYLVNEEVVLIKPASPNDLLYEDHGEVVIVPNGNADPFEEQRTVAKVMMPNLTNFKTARKKLPDTRASVTHKFCIDGNKGYFTVGLYDDGTPGEIFCKMNKAGTTLSGMLDAWAMMTSVALQYHVPLDTIIRLYAGTRYEPSGFTDNLEIKTCSSVHDYIVRWLELRFLKKDAASGESVVMSGQMCPNCGVETVRQGGCLVCIREGCAWSRC